MLKIISVLILSIIFIIIVALLVKQAKEKSLDYGNTAFKIVDFIVEEDTTIGILLFIIVLICIIVFAL